nr:MAG TPA: hypothetical protein [Caudoviricetes sp.]DAL26696.1 MAG TPA_asm: hypothetical protein [Caudoviricetes sp.]
MSFEIFRKSVYYGISTWEPSAQGVPVPCD